MAAAVWVICTNRSFVETQYDEVIYKAPGMNNAGGFLFLVPPLLRRNALPPAGKQFYC